jgi:hypothetical protein
VQIGEFVWRDTDGDGVQEPGEPGLNGVRCGSRALRRQQRSHDSSDLTVDFGLFADGGIGDRVWRDDDGDGVQGSDEPSLGGVTLTLTDAQGHVTTTATDTNGQYYVPIGAAATYTVSVTPPAGFGGVTPGQGSTGKSDSYTTEGVATHIATPSFFAPSGLSDVCRLAPAGVSSDYIPVRAVVAAAASLSGELTLTSTRRFFARPSRVRFESTGLVSP